MIKKANHLELSPAQVERLVEKLPMKHKLRLIDKLSKETSGTRMNKAVTRVREILRRIDARKGTRPSTRDILQEIHAYRRQKAPRRPGRQDEGQSFTLA